MTTFLSVPCYLEICQNHHVNSVSDICISLSAKSSQEKTYPMGISASIGMCCEWVYLSVHGHICLR